LAWLSVFWPDGAKHRFPNSWFARTAESVRNVRVESTAEVAAGSDPDDPRVRAQKSRLTNRALLPGIDGRSAWVRRCKDVIEQHLADLPDATTAERSIIRRAAVLTTELERLEQKFALAGEANPFDLDLYQRTAGGLRRLLEAIGLERRLRDVTNPAPRSRVELSSFRRALQDAVDADEATS
jgi:hypothetical protein